MRFFLLALLVAASFACTDKKNSDALPPNPNPKDPVKPKPDGAPDLFAARSAHYKGFVTAVRAARGTQFALVHLQLKKGEVPRSWLLERTAQGNLVERASAGGGDAILGFDVSDEELCLLRSAEVDARDPVTHRKYVDLRVQCDGVAGGQPLVFHDPDLAQGVKIYDKYGVGRDYRAPVAGKTVFSRRDLQRPFAQLKLVGREKILLLSGDFGERLYRINKDGALVWDGKGREVRPLTEIFADNGAPRAVPRLAVAGGKIMVLGGFLAEEHPIFVQHYQNQRLIPPPTGHREGLLASAWDLDGHVLWQRPLGADDALLPTAVSIGAEGFTALAHLGERRRASWIGRFGLDGAPKWARALSGKDLVTRMNALVERGDIIAAGSCRGAEADDGAVVTGSQGCVYRFEIAGGALSSARDFGAAKDDALFAVDLLENGKLLIGGYVDGPTGRAGDAGNPAQTYAWGTW